MKRYSLKTDMQFFVSECLAWPLKAELTMSKDKQKTTYKVGDFVLLYDANDALQLAFMKKEEFEYLFQTTGDRDAGVADTFVGDVRDRLSGGGIDPFRPKTNQGVRSPTTRTTGAREQSGDASKKATRINAERFGEGRSGEFSTPYEAVGDAS
jgi:hypothetical protein